MQRYAATMWIILKLRTKITRQFQLSSLEDRN